jgi:hypothetical protein
MRILRVEVGTYGRNATARQTTPTYRRRCSGVEPCDWGRNRVAAPGHTGLVADRFGRARAQDRAPVAAASVAEIECAISGA